MEFDKKSVEQQNLLYLRFAGKIFKEEFLVSSRTSFWKNLPIRMNEVIL